MAQKDYKLEIILELLRGENHARGIAKALHTNHMNISRKLNELFKGNVVDFRINGKNKTYFIKKTSESRSYALMAENYKLLNILFKYPLLRGAIEKIQKHSKIKMAFLFGSYAKSLAKQDSDIDIYIETIDQKIKRDLEKVDSQINIKIGKFEIDSLLIKEIIKNHIIIKGTDEYYDKIELFS